MRGDGKQLATILEGAGEEEEEEGEMEREMAYTSDSERYSQCAMSGPLNITLLASSFSLHHQQQCQQLGL